MPQQVQDLDLEFVRAQFPAFAEPGLAGQRPLENAGGSYACGKTIDALGGYYRRLKTQPYHPSAPSMAAGAAMDAAYERWAATLGVKPDEVNFGPSTSANTYVLAHAFAGILEPDAEIIVTNADHEANTGAIRRMAEERGLGLREWRVDGETGQLGAEGLEALLNDKTALVCMPHCSNIVGEENPVTEWTAIAKQAARSPWVVVDGVSHAPHSLPDVGAIGCDVYLFSLYKVYSVHQGLMVVRGPLGERLPNQGHFFNADDVRKRLNPAGPDHAQIAASAGVLDYVEALDAHHGGGGGNLRARADRVNALWKGHENAIIEPLLSYLRGKNGVRLIGSARVGSRHPTVSFTCARNPMAVAIALGERGVMAGAGHCYAYRLMEALGVDPQTGVVRLSAVHYNSADDIAATCEALEAIL